MRLGLPLILLLATFVAPRAWGGVAVLEAVRDNTLFEDAEGDTSNGSGPAFYAGVNGQGRNRRALLAFDVAGNVPVVASIDSVRLALYVSSAPDTVSRDFTLHRVLADWGEGSSYSSGGGGAPAAQGDATWLHAFYPVTPWTAPGGDFVPTASAVFRVGDVELYTVGDPAMAADVRSWLDHPETAFGWLLRGDERLLRTVRRFDSREADLPFNRPTLTIYYSEPVTSSSTTWGRVKEHFR